MSTIKEVEALSDMFGSTFAAIEVAPGAYSLGNFLYDTEIEPVRRAILKCFGPSSITFVRDEPIGRGPSVYTILIVQNNTVHS